MNNWIRIDRDEDDPNSYDIILPDNDSAPHSNHVFIMGEKKEAIVDGIDCPCKPNVDFIGRMIIHHAFDGRK